MSENQTTVEKTVSSNDATAALDGIPAGNKTQPQQAQQGPDLTVSDLIALKNIIDVASSRGAFKPNEMTVVGQTYTKLEEFLQAVQKSQGAQNG